MGGWCGLGCSVGVETMHLDIMIPVILSRCADEWCVKLRPGALKEGQIT
jgi:hypothetical protein